MLILSLWVYNYTFPGRWPVGVRISLSPQESDPDRLRRLESSAWLRARAYKQKKKNLGRTSEKDVSVLLCLDSWQLANNWLMIQPGNENSPTTGDGLPLTTAKCYLVASTVAMSPSSHTMKAERKSRQPLTPKRSCTWPNPHAFRRSTAAAGWTHKAAHTKEHQQVCWQNKSPLHDY